MLEHAAMCRPRPQRLLGQPPALSSAIYRLEEANRQHWPNHSDKRMKCAFVLHVGKGDASAQSVKSVTWACAFSGASRSTTERRDLVR
jgi:hypothetical protein